MSQSGSRSSSASPAVHADKGYDAKKWFLCAVHFPTNLRLRLESRRGKEKPAGLRGGASHLREAAAGERAAIRRRPGAMPSCRKKPDSLEV